MGVQLYDVRGVERGLFESLANGRFDKNPLLIGLRKMSGVRGMPISRDEAMNRSAPPFRMRLAFQYEKARALTQHQAIAMAIEGPTGFGSKR